MSVSKALKAASVRPSGSAPSGRRQGRSERTRQKIKDATIRLLDTRTYSDLAISDICREAGIATGGFYFHFERKADLIEEILREHNESFWSALMNALEYRDLYSAVFGASSALVRAYHDSPGLVRCFNQLAMIDRTYVKLWENAATAWTAKLDLLLAEQVRPKPGEARPDTYGLLSFADLFLFGIFIERNAPLVASAGSLEEIAENLAVLWFRALTGHSPAESRLALPRRHLGV
jgi:TetR/AcrR family transcriptional regulator, ethionamide resistance regulator